MAPTPIDDLLHLLRSSGGRVTAARRSILEEMTTSKDHLTADQLWELVRIRHAEIDRSTVYRFLDDLEALHVVDHVHLGHGAAVYHLTGDRHHHLVCQACSRVVEVPEAEFNVLQAELRTKYGFLIDPHHFALPGLCEACADRTDSGQA